MGINKSIQAKWINDGDYIMCSNCHHYFDIFRNIVSDFNYCPSCGCKINGKEKWYFTFGCDSEHPGKYVVFDGTFDEAREKMMNRFGDDWAFQYSEEDFADISSRWHYEELEDEQV